MAAQLLRLIWRIQSLPRSLSLIHVEFWRANTMPSLRSTKAVIYYRIIKRTPFKYKLSQITSNTTIGNAFIKHRSLPNKYS
jgi:hypothetical protein